MKFSNKFIIVVGLLSFEQRMPLFFLKQVSYSVRFINDFIFSFSLKCPEGEDSSKVFGKCCKRLGRKKCKKQHIQFPHLYEVIRKFYGKRRYYCFKDISINFYFCECRKAKVSCIHIMYYEIKLLNCIHLTYHIKVTYKCCNSSYNILNYKTIPLCFSLLLAVPVKQFKL